jgi:chitin synthase
LRFVAGAIADTDAPPSLVELIKQRRRWLNGSFFSLLYYLHHFPRVLMTNHSLLRKAALALQWGFQVSARPPSPAAGTD